MKKLKKYLKKSIFLSAILLGLGLLGLSSLFCFELQARQSSIVLQPHQQTSVDYLLRHPELKGLLLYHSLGSGKTYLALDYAEKSPYQKIVILVPDFLKSNWINQMKSFGVKDPSHFELISFNEEEKLLSRDLSKTLVIVDEIHKLIHKIRIGDFQTSEKSLQIYEKIKSAGKLLLLTGTPIFYETSDISYIANLLEQNKDYPIDPIKFKIEYMKIKPTTSLVRGYVTESKIITLGFPFLVTMAAAFTLAASAPLAIPFVALGGGAIIPIVNELLPVNQVSFVEFDTEKWKNFASQYVSYYEVKLGNDENYPRKELIDARFQYTDEQTDFFLSFIDEELNLSQLKMLLAEKQQNLSDTYMKTHSSTLQKHLLSDFNSGKDIGNFDFKDDRNERVESRKFLEIYEILKENSGQAVVYSNYYVNGIQKFASFLDRHGMKKDYAFLLPTDSVEKQGQIIQQYNDRAKRILLIHPEITEGISLIGTEQFHILEPISNPTLLDQIIGRAIRFRSHAHLPKEHRLVKVYLWQGQIDYGLFNITTNAGLIKREHWQKKYSEVNPSSWSKGILDLDSNYFIKGETPDQRSLRKSKSISNNIESFKELLEEYSIERKSQNLTEKK